MLDLLKDKWMQRAFGLISALLIITGGLFFFFENPNGIIDYITDPPATTPVVAGKQSHDNQFADIPGYNDAIQLQTAFVRNAKKIKPSVVSINSLRLIKKDSKPGAFQKSPGAWFYQFKEWVEEVTERQYEVEHLGSGIVLDHSGHILTNYHVIEEAGRLLVKVNEHEYYAKIVGTDPTTDLAVLKVFSFKGFTSPEFGKSEELNVGEWVMAIGNPYGLEGTVTVGVISGKGRSDLGIATYENFLQTDASINPGNSGGPLINIEGQVIGVSTAVAELGAGVGFAIPIEMAKKIADDLINNGKVERGWLGVGIQPVTPELATSFNTSYMKGSVIVNVVNNKAPALAAGIKQGDIITQFDGQPLSGTKNFQQLVINTRIGKTVPLKVIRDGNEKTLSVKIGKLEDK